MQRILREMGKLALLAGAFMWSAPDLASAQSARYCVTSVDRYGTAPVVTRPDGGPIAHELRIGQCGIRITGECLGAWCQVSFRGGYGWVHMRHLSKDRR